MLKLQKWTRQRNPFLGPPACMGTCVLNHFSCVRLLCDPMDCSLPGFSVHGILQARILEWMAISFSRGSSQPRDQTRVLRLLALAGGFFTTSATCEPLPWTPVQIQFTAEVSVQMVVKFSCHKVKFSLSKVPGRLLSGHLSCAFKGWGGWINWN